GLFVLSWPGRGQGRRQLGGALLGLASGLSFAVALNTYRQASIALEPRHLLFAAVASVCVAQALQSLVLGLALAAVRPAVLRAVAQSWRASLGAGFFGAA